MTKYIIKFHDLYFNEYHITNGGYARIIDDATKYIHADVARQKIIDLKLPTECKVFSVDFVEREV